MFVGHGSVVHRIEMIHRSDALLEDLSHRLGFSEHVCQRFDPILLLTF